MAEQVSKVVDPTPKNRFETDDDQNSKSRDFFWDQLVKVATSGMLLIAALDIVTSLSSDPVKCQAPDHFTRDQSAYMNGYCSEKTPKVDYFLFFIVGQAIVLAGPHFTWTSWFSGQLTHFISEALSLKRHRESSTGKYPKSNFVSGRSLQNIYGSSKAIHRVYFLKILLQLILALFSAAIAGGVFYEMDRPDIFDTVFSCEHNGPYTNFLEVEDYVFNVTCVVLALRSHRAVWITNFILLGLIAVSMLVAILWWLWPHVSILNWNEAAVFSLESGIEPHHYRSKLCTCSFEYQIRTDLDFLLLRLYSQDEGHGKVLRELLIVLTMEELLREAKQDLSLRTASPNMNTEDTSDQESSFLIPPKPSSRKNIKEVFMQTKRNLASFLLEIIQSYDFGFDGRITAVDLAFGTQGFSILLAPLSEHVATVNLDHRYLNEKESARAHNFPTGICEIQTRSDIYAQPVRVSNDFSTEFFYKFVNKEKGGFTHGRSNNRIKLFVVGPFSDPDRVVTIHWFMFKIMPFIEDKAILIVLRPTKIGRSNVEKDFRTFQPIWPWGQKDEGQEGYSDTENFHFGQEHSFLCSNIECRFRIDIYKVSKNLWA
jgi:hypothetical protein